MGLPLTFMKNPLTIKYFQFGGRFQSNFGKTEESRGSDLMAVDCFVLKMRRQKMPGIRGPYDYWIQALTHVWELCSTSGSCSWQNDAWGIRPCNKGRGTTHCLVTLSETVWHAEVGTESRYLPPLDKSRVFDKTMCGLGWLRLWNLSNSLAMWECGQSEERENTLGRSQSEHSAFFFLHALMMYIWLKSASIGAWHWEEDREANKEQDNWRERASFSFMPRSLKVVRKWFHYQRRNGNTGTLLPCFWVYVFLQSS